MHIHIHLYIYIGIDIVCIMCLLYHAFDLEQIDLSLIFPGKTDLHRGPALILMQGTSSKGTQLNKGMI